MTTQEWSLIVAGVGILGTISGAMANSLITRSTQRQQWVRDKKMQEYRELLGTMSKAEMLFIRYRGVVSGEDERKQEEAEIEAWTIIKDRIFVAGVMDKENIRERWGQIIRKYHDERDLTELVKACAEMRQGILTAAFKDLGIE